MDVRRINPIGFAYIVPGGWAVAGTGPPDERWAVGLQVTRRTLGGATPQIVTGTGPALVKRLRDCLGVLDHSGFHRSAAARAGRLIMLGAAGVPVVLVNGLDPQTRQLLGSELCLALETATVDSFVIPEHRERQSVALRRAALRVAGLPTPEPPSVSIVLATYRADWLPHALSQVNKQTYEPRELVLVLHGSRFPTNVTARVTEEVDGPCEIVRVPREASLGDALNAGVAAASGEIITKMDDDDWYGSAHVWDLVAALSYSGAQLVGKGAEFVYLAELDITIRRFTGRAETPSRTIGGGSLTLRKDDLRAAGNWPPLCSRVDQSLIDAVLREGGKVHRTHGYAYLLNRHNTGHTWSAHVDYFLAQSEAQHRGLDLAFADCLD
jgi:Glycosyl transferase family 2